MSSRRVGSILVVLAATLVCVSCGQIYRPVVIPTNTTPPNPANFHNVFALSANVPGNPGAAMQITVSGDAVLAQTPSDANSKGTGDNPTHIMLLPNNSRIFVANAGSIFPDGSVNFSGTDFIATFTPSPDSTAGTGFGAVAWITYPTVAAGPSATITAISESGNLVTATLSSALSDARVGSFISISGVQIVGNNTTGYNGSFPLTFVSGNTIQYIDPIAGLPPVSSGEASLPTFCSYLPDYLATSQTNAVYVSNYGAENGLNCNLASTDSVAVVNTTTNTIGNIIYLPAGAHPVALAETPDGRKLYVVNQGNNTVASFNTVDMSQNAVTFTGGAPGTPVWVIARNDNHRVYVITQGDGQLITLDAVTDTEVGRISVGAGANFASYDVKTGRLYVANPVTGTVFVLSTTGGTNDTPIVLKQLTIPGLCATCNAPAPTQVAALRDGSRFYVASYQTANVCPDPNVSGPCVVPQATVYDANSFSLKTSLFLLASPTFKPTPDTNPQPYAVAPLTSCVPPATYTPGSTRFRTTATASADSSRVYIGMCDAGAIAVINTTTSTIGSGSTNTPDTLVLDLLAPFSNGAPQSNGEPPPQNPIFMITGQ